ncbi:nucleotide exchange factor GrpE [Novosphingobium pentaromativorans]|uniref:Protein GrpE n=1 Tax=Novosphingobium pentaromativorans US6-1 TaxID=1088721 RepID=G6EJ38_9SPHN|nr:nucleotide exchange factor GrpE [Novosphingobium pentaromativorans]AIT78997.1 molecular chaperone GrpE [Novosphingobium pentaromativorans US6-1]EHJ58624.1 molecular chaperone GrpE [Novosphingobium pentaromativorans US6-1]
MTEDKTQPSQDQAADPAVAEELKGVPEHMVDKGADNDVAEDELAKLREELEVAKQDVLYARAETQNVRRRLEKDIADTRNYAATGFARDILSVADNLSRALSAIPADLREDEKVKTFIAGIEATSREIEKVFGTHGITRIAAMGMPLDPNQHQAMIEVPSADAEPGTVVQELQAGYMIKDRLLRPAMVAVAKKPD